MTDYTKQSFTLTKDEFEMGIDRVINHVEQQHGGTRNAVVETSDMIRQELKETKDELSETKRLLEMRKPHKTTFYIGIAIGIIALIIGVIVSNYFYAFLGFGIFATSLSSTLEARKNGW